GGSFCTQPGAKWLPLAGECHYAATPPAFLWWGKIPMGLGLSVGAQDRYAAGHGRMFVRINSLWPIVDAQGAEIAQSALGRLLAEGPLLPTALLPTFIGSVARDTAPSGISWEAVDVHTARATLRDGDLTATALFHFGPDHLIERVTLDRYRAAGDRTVLTPFAGRLSDYRDFDGLLLPTQLEAAWVLPGGEFPFARFSITGVRFDDPRGPAELERAETEASVHGRQAAREQPRPTAVGAARVRAELAVK
ncbi:MAG TPA: DUF6544 family protein, partial [Planctomycetota bacterium]|nr:DUF6544 family protein [Planctomycetota bacterium]